MRYDQGFVYLFSRLTNAPQAAKRDLHAECGPDMNTWVVGRRPVGLYEDGYKAQDPQYAGEKVRALFLQGLSLAEVGVSAGLLLQSTHLRGTSKTCQQTHH